MIGDIEELTKRLLPLTYFRRNAGEILEKLEKIGTIILTKDGKPVAKLTSLYEKNELSKKEKIIKLKKLAGGFHLGKISPKKIRKIIYQRYEKVLS